MADIRNAQVLQLVGKQRLQSLLQRSNYYGLQFLSAHLVLTALSGALLWLAQSSWWLIPALIIHGIVLVHWFAPFHESVHETAFRSSRLNSALAWFAGLIIIIVPPYFKYEHVAHHAYTADKERDPESIPIGETFWGYLYYASAIPYFIGIVSVMARAPFAHFTDTERRFLPVRRRTEVQHAAWIMWLVYGLLAAISIWFQSWAVVMFWLLPRIIGEPFMRLIRMSEHVGCAKVADMLRNTRTVISIKPVRLLAWNMCYHAEHHALPRVPFHALPELHDIIQDHLVYRCRGYLQAQRDLIRNGLHNNNYL